MGAPAKYIEWDNVRIALPSFLTITIVPFTYGIHNGVLAGLFVDSFLNFAEICFGSCQKGGEGGTHEISKMVKCESMCPDVEGCRFPEWSDTGCSIDTPNNDIRLSPSEQNTS